MYLFRDAEDDGEEAASDEDRPRHLDLVGGEVEPRQTPPLLDNGS
jgi:hypothetical protein